MKKRFSLSLFILLSIPCLPQSSENPHIPLGELLVPSKAPSQNTIPDAILRLPFNPEKLDTAADWQLLSYESRGWQQIAGQPRHDHVEMYSSKNEAMALSAALLVKTFQLNDSSGSWHLTTNRNERTMTIFEYGGNPYANVTSWENLKAYTFRPAGKFKSQRFLLDSLLEDTADPAPFFPEQTRSETNSAANFTILQPYAVADTSHWLLLGYDHRAWSDILGKNAHTNYYKKYIAKPNTLISGASLAKQFGSGIKYVSARRSEWDSFSGWNASISDTGIMIIRMNTYQPGNMTDWGSETSYYFKRE